MLRLTNEKFSKLDVVTTVRVPIPDVGTARGSLQLDKAMKKIKDREITLREAAGHGIAGHQGFNRCNCKTGCGTKKCTCNLLCSSKCHGNQNCTNK
ncbi:unnamed protein product [Macrosiphum euphorbiae]|uniref:Metallothionein n=1 Tax=Macrosiphum euphorbiae TaxID=13131 RepID=A0AAV0WHX4_9HEMI|nr:unnamed protein product [Macrosiphum euphorbiae]